MAYNKTTIDKIASQALEEIDFARQYKQGKVQNWQKNEQLYYGEKIRGNEARSNVSLGRMQEFVHTLLSKIDNPLTFNFTKTKNSQLKRVEILNSLKRIDADKGFWDMKDIVGKKQAILYGRAIYAYYADSVNRKYKSHLEPIDVYDFLIDPACGGIDLEQAMYMGDYSVVLTAKDLRNGMKSGKFIKKAVSMLLEGGGNADDSSQEETNKKQRQYAVEGLTLKEESNKGKFRFWRWTTTYVEDGERYYLLLDNSGNCIKCEKLTDIFPATEDYPAGAFPYWSWASFPDLTEFWTPSYADYAREIFMAQDVSINQALDNAEAINKPMRIVNVDAIENLASLKYRRDGIIPTKGAYDANRAIQVIQTPSIQTPIQVFNLLEAIQQKASGVTEQTAGVADIDGKVGIYEGNQEATADRFGLLNKSYAHGYRRFAKLYELGVRENLVKKVAIDILGPDGVEVKEVSRRDIFKDGEEYAVMVEASNAQTLSSMKDKEAKVTFLSSFLNSGEINRKKAFEMQARIVGFTEDEVEELLDTSFYGNSELMSEADRDIEALLENEKIKPNQGANNAYKQKLVTYMYDNEENMNDEQFRRIADYIVALEPIIMRNEARALEQEQIQMMNQMAGQLGQPQGRVPRIQGEEVVAEPLAIPNEPI